MTSFSDFRPRGELCYRNAAICSAPSDIGVNPGFREDGFSSIQSEPLLETQVGEIDGEVVKLQARSVVSYVVAMDPKGALR